MNRGYRHRERESYSRDPASDREEGYSGRYERDEEREGDEGSYESRGEMSSRGESRYRGSRGRSGAENESGWSASGPYETGFESSRQNWGGGFEGSGRESTWGTPQ